MKFLSITRYSVLESRPPLSHIRIDTSCVSAGLVSLFFRFAIGGVFAVALLGPTMPCQGAEPEFNKVGTIEAPDGGAGDAFGFGNVAISGDTIVVGAWGIEQNKGAVYVFRRDGGNWVLQDDFSPGDAQANDRFGSSVAISGDTFAVANARQSSGKVYLYSRSGNVWSETKIIETGRSGYEVRIDLAGDTLVVGTPGAPSVNATGVVQVYVRTGNDWILQQTLLPSETAANDKFGADVSISGNRLLVGSYGAAETKGRAYLFERIGSTWSQTKQFQPSDPSQFGDLFGWDVEIDGDTAVVSSKRKWFDPPGFYGGEVYVFGLTGADWTEQQQITLQALDPTSVPKILGKVLDLDGDRLMVQAGTGNDRFGHGIGYLLQRSSGQFTLQQKIDPASSMAIRGGTMLLSRHGAPGVVDVYEQPNNLVVGLEAFDLEGNPIEGEITTDQTFDVDVTIDNQSSATLTNLNFANGAPLVIDPRSPGGVVIVSKPASIPTSLPANQKTTLRYRLTTTSAGLAGAHVKLTASAQGGEIYEDVHSLRMDIEEASVVVEEARRFLLVLALERASAEIQRQFQQRMDALAEDIRDELLKILPKDTAEKWLGKLENFGRNLFEIGQAELDGTSPKMVDVRLPDEELGNHTIDELNSTYNQTFLEEAGKGVKNWVKGWGALAAKPKRIAVDAFEESVLAARYFTGNATQEQTQEFFARMVAEADARDAAAGSLIDLYNKEYFPRLQRGEISMNGLLDLVSSKGAELVGKAFFEGKAFNADQRLLRHRLLKLADKDPVRFQQEWAKADAAILNKGMPLILDTLVGGTVVRGLGGARRLVIKGPGGAVVKAGQAAGVLDETGTVIGGSETAIAAADSAVPRGIRATDAPRNSDEFLSNVDGATVVQSTDLGKVYELPNLGGVPEITLDAKAGILAQLEKEYLAVKGAVIKLVEVLKPSSALRKDGGIAKLELVEQKTGKPAMLDAGMPPEALGEACVWRNTVPPNQQPGFANLSKPRQQAALKEWELANEQWANWDAPKADSKTERLQACLGKVERVPLDLKPNKKDGLQRFVRAEYEIVTVQHGTAEARLIRVKEYSVEVVDTKSGRVVNGRTVVERSEQALPQGPDADAVAVGKVVGTDAQGRPIIQPLDRAEREFIMQRYIEKNVKARRTGLIPDAAEHGVTMVMDDASAKLAGKLLPKYGVPFLPEQVGLEYLRRIAPFVKTEKQSVEEMVEVMKKLVMDEGGFGQKAVVVTSDSRYFGELAVSAW